MVNLAVKEALKTLKKEANVLMLHVAPAQKRRESGEAAEHKSRDCSGGGNFLDHADFHLMY